MYSFHMTDNRTIHCHGAFIVTRRAGLQLCAAGFYGDSCQDTLLALVLADQPQLVESNGANVSVAIVVNQVGSVNAEYQLDLSVR